MKHLFRALCVAAGLSALVSAQTQDPPAKPGDPGAGGTTPVMVTGCLQEEAGGRFSLTEEPTAAAAAGKTYRLSASSGVDLKPHVGHKVQVSGTKAGKEPTAKVVEHQDPNMLKVTAVKMLSETCPTVK